MVDGQEGERAPGHLWRFTSSLSRGDRIAIAVLIVVPVLLVLPFSIAGHPVIPGDDLTQNYPLRVLSGQVLASGHLPSFDPFLWSGTPLLAGWNAGALYPGTWLFAVMPGVAAWTANVIAVSVVCATGTYALCRRFGCRPLAAAIGALVFSETGFMSGQLVHLGLVQGTGYLPWSLLGIEWLVAKNRVRDAGAPIVFLGVVLALCVLAGEPRAISTEVIVLIVYALGRAVRLSWPRRRTVLIGTTLGGALGAGISAIQWIPGLSFVSASQRGLGSYAAFGAGSLGWETIGHLLLVPFLLGGNGNFGLPTYEGGYNLPELMIGVGLLPLAAVFAYLPELGASATRVLRATVASRAGTTSPTCEPVEEPTRSSRPLALWYVIGLVGMVLTMGTTTRLGALLVRIPFYGGERLQNRNAAIFDFALAMLAAYLIEDLLARRHGRADQPLSTWSSRLLALLPPAAAVALIAAAYLRPRGLEHAFGVAHPSFALISRLTPYFVATLVVALGLVVFVLLAPRLSFRSRSLALAVLAFGDVGIYVANASYETAPSSVLGGTTALSARLAALVGPDGRFALYDPLSISMSNPPGIAAELGETDLNALRGIPSVQGYGSIVVGTYQDATGTHDFERLDAGALSSGLFDDLDLRVLLALPVYLGIAIPAHSAIPVAGASAVPASGGAGAIVDAPPPTPLASGPWTVVAGGESRWLLPSVGSVIRATIVVNAVSGRRPATIEVGTEGPHGTTQLSPVPVHDGEAQVSFSSAERASAIVVRNPTSAAATIGAVVAVTGNPDQRLLLDGALQGDLNAGHWSEQGKLGPFDVFTNSQTAGAAWLQPLGSTSPDVSNQAPGAISAAAPTSATQPMTVDAASPSLLVRSETYESGWTALLTPRSGGPARVVRVERLGLLQAIEVPAGPFVVTWRYAPRALLVGLATTIASLVLLVVISTLMWRARWRKRARRAVQASPRLSSSLIRGRQPPSQRSGRR